MDSLSGGRQRKHERRESSSEGQSNRAPHFDQRRPMGAGFGSPVERTLDFIRASRSPAEPRPVVSLLMRPHQTAVLDGKDITFRAAPASASLSTSRSSRTSCSCVAIASGSRCSRFAAISSAPGSSLVASQARREGSSADCERWIRTSARSTRVGGDSESAVRLDPRTSGRVGHVVGERPVTSSGSEEARQRHAKSHGPVTTSVRTPLRHLMTSRR